MHVRILEVDAVAHHVALGENPPRRNWATLGEIHPLGEIQLCQIPNDFPIKMTPDSRADFPRGGRL